MSQNAGKQLSESFEQFQDDVQALGNASVLMKVIRVPRDLSDGKDAFEEMVSKIVAGANWQNAIRASDLMSNDRIQIDLERGLRKLGYFYMRKRQTKGEVKQLIGNGQYLVVSKEEFAQASGGCNLDPHTIRAGLEKLFMEDRYAEVFPNSDPHYYLPRYWLMRAVTYAAKGAPERGYAKWLVLNFMWTEVSPLVQSPSKARAFRILSERSFGPSHQPNVQDFSCWLNWVADEVFRESLKYYRQNCGSGDGVLDISQFFRNQKGHHTQFAKHWKSLPSSRRQKVERWLDGVRDTINQFEE